MRMDRYRIIPIGTVPQKWAIERTSKDGQTAQLILTLDTREEANAALSRIRMARLAHTKTGKNYET